MKNIEPIPLIDTAIDQKKKPNLIAHLESEDCLVNLAGDYDYLTSGYYLSQEMENQDKNIHPTCKEILDAYVTPLSLEKARLNNIAVPEFYVTNGHFEPPVIIDTMNPFMSRHSVVLKTSYQERAAKSLTRNFTYAICCQELPPDSRVVYFHSILGWCAASKYRTISQQIWDVFKIPIVKVRLIALENGQFLLSSLDPLPVKKLTPREAIFINENVKWQI